MKITFENEQEADDILITLVRQRERINNKMEKISSFGSEISTLRNDREHIQAIIAACVLAKAMEHTASVAEVMHGTR